MKALLALVFLSLMAGTFVSAADKRRVSFIFDDGPVPQQTERMLAVLKEHDVRVNFAYVGEKVVTNPELAKAALSAGHEIQNHSFTHPHLKALDDKQVLSELSNTSEVIKAATGKGPAYLWAPFLEYDERVEGHAREVGLVHFPLREFNLVSTDDWNTATTAETIYRKATTDIKDGTVVLCHEWREETLAQLPAIITELKKQGFEFVAFSELKAPPQVSK